MTPNTCSIEGMDRLFAVEPENRERPPRPLAAQDKETCRRGLLRARAALAEALANHNPSGSVAA